VAFLTLKWTLAQSLIARLMTKSPFGALEDFYQEAQQGEIELVIGGRRFTALLFILSTNGLAIQPVIFLY
jgi:hypothetical protein